MVSYGESTSEPHVSRDSIIQINTKAGKTTQALLLGGTPFRIDLTDGNACKCILAQDQNSGDWICAAIEIVQGNDTRFFWSHY